MEPEKENLREFRYADLRKATKNFTQYLVKKSNDTSIAQTFYGYVNETTFAPSRTGIAVSVMECYQDNTKDLQDWKVSKICLVILYLVRTYDQ